MILGKTHVESTATADLFEGVVPNGIKYRPAPPFTPREATAAALELGGSWRFYRDFWPAHGLEHLANLVQPEVEVNFASFLWVPLLIENPTERPLNVTLAIDVPDGWNYVRKPSLEVTVPPHQTYSLHFELKTPEERVEGWKTVSIRADAGGTQLGSITLRVQLNGGALSQ